MSDLLAPKGSTSLVTTVNPSENITLTCNIVGKHQVAWYHLTADELTLLVSAEKSMTENILPIDYNKDGSRFVLKADSEATVARFTIVKVGKDDLGVYFCGTKAEWSQMLFGKPILVWFEALINLNITRICSAMRIKGVNKNVTL
ncbi:hypothetical protein NFI96_008766 [Prochilodus magdalenae]|nr:hypothetical protein NFI96_008766 [Prochilodus magdalenae]